MLLQQPAQLLRHPADLGEFPQVRVDQQVDLIDQLRRRRAEARRSWVHVAQEAWQQRGAQSLTYRLQSQRQLGQPQP